jgi:hypothetical protein
MVSNVGGSMSLTNEDIEVYSTMGGVIGVVIFLAVTIYLGMW